ncbi:lysophospholipid acyltransferase family protein [Propionibacterium australiense]|uniref:Acyltransferase n=1 Tax=Propionibacterium australiense TaxID=119981 RepID=A0A383S941_9ACTN|nr:lysophospholipid acyltransferase family protein [Propionibacterium australiense]RLP07112.1 1-acyl-sn-glycerol-3-phosphate acyltransferase [Propionibacterium australiense]RLP07880.1 1-acyl-sn-glycerol-3-phosphate acyltransferase [Propionibacterium australiense]SYZ33786.1 Acyltransferase [Propionibacterium australiense]VEH88763.1 Bifunctional protein aas [Propionibacterium australiense]
MDFGRNPRLYKSTVAAIARDSVRFGLIKPVLNRAVKLHVHGKEHLDGLRAPFLVTPNHSGHLDGPLIMLTMPNRLTKELATGAAADYFFDKWYTAMGTHLLMNAFPVDRTRSKGKNHRGMAGELLDAGVSLLIFPEGTRSRTGGMGRFKPGTAALAIAHNVPIVPVALVGSWAAWPPTEKRWLPGRPDVHVVYGAPMTAEPGEIAHEFSERVRRKIIEMHDGVARAYGMPTQAEMMHLAAIERARTTQEKDQKKDA